MAQEKAINVYGIEFTPEQRAERSTWHETTWLEWEIPQALEEELNKIINKKIKQFEKKCQCGLCKLNENKNE